MMRLVPAAGIASALHSLSLALCLFNASPAQSQSMPAEPASAMSTHAVQGTALPASIPLRRDPVHLEPAAGWQVLVAIAGAAVLFVLWARRRRGGAGLMASCGGVAAAPGLKIMVSKTFGPNMSIQVVQWGSEELLLACTPQQISLLKCRPLFEEARTDAEEGNK